MANNSAVHLLKRELAQKNVSEKIFAFDKKEAEVRAAQNVIKK